jgi:hypothetical protein
MEVAANRLPDAPVEAGALPAKRRSKKATRPQLLMRSSLDGRTNAARYFDKLAADIEADLGGRDRLSAIERALVEAFCGAAVTMFALNTKLALGQPIDLSQHAQCVGAMVRVASRLGVSRRAKDVGPSLNQYLESLVEDEADEAERNGDGAGQYPRAADEK